MNMGHTRFTNTVGDLQDCLDHLEDELSPAESRARRRLILTAWDIVQSFLDDEGKLDPAIIDELPKEAS